MARMKAMLKTKAMMPPDPDPEDQPDRKQEKGDARVYERLEQKASITAQSKQKPPSIAAMIKVAAKKRSN